MIKQFILGFLLCYTILITAYAAGLHNGRIASIGQACVEKVSDYATQLERARK